MFTIRRFRLIALIALSAFAFAQAAVAAMGCATLRADTTQAGSIAVMPDGSPCDMLGSLPAPLCKQHCAQDGAASGFDVATHFAALPVLPVLAIRAPLAGGSAAMQSTMAAPPILGPPPLLLTLRLRH